ncbi:MAG: zinc ribbon domain-containing protein [Candidatus Eisenbacteria bacterium]|nr:zinc ribbon domain-containing protein [Candidatus Eisenbacteria bacterium]
MPTYEYVCDKCGHEFELFQKMTDPVRKRCPRCRGAVRRRIGAGAGLLFKGSGFYATDYRSPEYRAKTKAERGGGDAGAKPATEKSGDAKKPDASAKNAKPSP